MMRRLARLITDCSGAAAVEFACVLPVLVALMLMGVNAWLEISQTRDMTTAISTAARYYEAGGADDTAAQSAALTAWRPTPGDAAVAVSRYCACGSTVTDCSSICTGGAAAQVFVRVSATSTFQGLSGSHGLSQATTVRVR